MRVLIVDDERLARNELRRMLAAFPEVESVDEANGAAEALAKIRAAEPDLVFLDIQMPGGTGFDLLAELDDAPPVIFTTAYYEYALRAFEVNALDYLLKPVRQERLAAALAKVRPARGRPTEPEAMPASRRIFVKDGERCWFVAVGDIALLESEGNYTRLHFGAERPLIPRSLNYLAQRLDEDVFFRASRRHILNTRFIERIEPAIGGGLTVSLRGAPDVEMSRRQAQRFRTLMSL